MVNSRAKGAAGERELAAILRKQGFAARRGQQFCGSNGDADVVGVPGLHIECKRVEKLNLDAAYKQSVRDARAGEIPAVIHRRNGEQWKVTVSLEDFIEIWKGREHDERGEAGNPDGVSEDAEVRD